MKDSINMRLSFGEMMETPGVVNIRPVYRGDTNIYNIKFLDGSIKSYVASKGYLISID